MNNVDLNNFDIWNFRANNFEPLSDVVGNFTNFDIKNFRINNFAFTNFLVDAPTIESATYSTGYGALASLLNNLESINLGTTGFLKEHTKLPYISISKSGDFFHTRYSCGTQLEDGIYQFNIFTESVDELQQIFYDLEGIYTNSVLPFSTPLKQACLEWCGQRIKELEPGIYKGTLLYHIIVQRDIPTTYTSIVTSGETLLGALKNRYTFFPEMGSVLNDFVTTKYQKEHTKLPYLSIDEFNTSEFDRTSQTRQEVSRFALKIYSESLDELEIIQSVIRKYYDNCILNVTSFGQFLCLSWTACTAVEMEPDIWEGTVEYELLLEKDINAYGS